MATVLKEKQSGRWCERVYSNMSPSESKTWLVTTATQS